MAISTVTTPGPVTRVPAPRPARGRRGSVWLSVARLPLYLFGLTMLLPFYWMALGAFKPVPELTRNPPSFVPRDPSLDSFYDPDWHANQQNVQHVPGLFQRFDNAPMRFGTFMLNSFLIVTAIVVGVLLIASLAGYALTKMDLPGRRIIFVFVVASIMVPWQVSLVPNYLIMKNLGWLNSYQAYIVPALPKAVVVFFLVQYLRSIPDDLIHAARVDGAGEWRIWWRVVLPLLRPALAAMAIFMVIWEWNNFLWPLIIVQDDSMANIPVGLARLNASNAFNPQVFGVAMAAALLASIPTVIFFLIFQKHFTQGIALSGIKG